MCFSYPRNYGSQDAVKLKRKNVNKTFTGTGTQQVSAHVSTLILPTTPFKILWQFRIVIVIQNCHLLSVFVICHLLALFLGISIISSILLLFTQTWKSKYYLWPTFVFSRNKVSFFFFLSLHSIIFWLQTKITCLLRSDHGLALASLPLDDAGCPWLRLSPSSDFSKIQIFFLFFFFCA